MSKIACVERSLTYETRSTFPLIITAAFFGFCQVIGGVVITLWNLPAKRQTNRKAAFPPAALLKTCSRSSHARLHLQPRGFRKSRNKVPTPVLPIGLLRQTISIVGQLRHALITWLLVVLYCVPRKDPGIREVSERTSTSVSQSQWYSESGVSAPLETLCPRISGTALAGDMCAKTSNFAATARKPRSWLILLDEMAHHVRETGIAVALFPPSPFPVVCKSDWTLILGIYRIYYPHDWFF